MYSLRQTIPKQKLRSVRGKPASPKSGFNFGYVIIILAVIVFFIRAMGVIINTMSEVAMHMFKC